MKYLCLRNCYTAEDRYYRAGETYELPDDMFKAEKNFRLVGEVPRVAPEVPVSSPSGVVGDSESHPTTESEKAEGATSEEQEAPLYVSPNPRPKKKKRQTKVGVTERG